MASKFAINLDRGVLIRSVQDTGMDVYMYRDDPGVYLTAIGNEVPEKIAEQAGFNVDRFRRLRNRKLGMARAAELLDEETALADNESQRTAVYDKDGFKVILYGLGRHIVEDPDGNNLTPGAALSLEAATRLADALASKGPDAAPAVVAVSPGDGPRRPVGTPRSGAMGLPPKE
jgi:hypothetical protein